MVNNLIPFKYFILKASSQFQRTWVLVKTFSYRIVFYLLWIEQFSSLGYSFTEVTQCRCQDDGDVGIRYPVPRVADGKVEIGCPAQAVDG